MSRDPQYCQPAGKSGRDDGKKRPALLDPCSVLWGASWHRNGLLLLDGRVMCHVKLTHHRGRGAPWLLVLKNIKSIGPTKILPGSTVPWFVLTGDILCRLSYLIIKILLLANDMYVRVQSLADRSLNVIVGGSTGLKVRHATTTGRIGHSLGMKGRP